MKLSPKQKKWAKGIAIAMLLRFIIGGALYYVIVYRFRDVLQYVVKKESANTYEFNASDIEVSLWDKNIVLNNAELSCKDTINTTPHYNIKIPQVYLSIDSWKDLIFHRKVSVDSLAIVLPTLAAHEHSKQPKKQVSFHVSQVSDMLHKLMVHLQVRSFSLQNGSFTYGQKSSLPFISSNINFIIRNFSKSNEGKKLLAADEIDLRLQDQNWHLPGGEQEVTFKRLHFSGSNQHFELDSFTFHTRDTAGGVFMGAEKLSFNSSRLSDLYEKERLVIDTIRLYRPSIRLYVANKPLPGDTSQVISQSFRKLFKELDFRYIDITEGALLLQKINDPQPAYITQKTDLRIYGLKVLPDSAHVITDSIQLKLRDLSFYTSDSLFKMTIGEFAFRNNELVFKNAEFSPTRLNRNSSRITFRTPSLQLKDFSLEDLLRKRLSGSEVILQQPQIIIEENKKTQPGHAKTDISNFYKTLHGLHELIDVDSFRIINGNAKFIHKGTSPLNADIGNIDAIVLLNQLFRSDSLVDIKRSLPHFRVGNVTVTSPKAHLWISNYTLSGYNRHNGIEKFRLEMPNHTTLEGENVYWEILDWDLLQRYHIIQAEDIHAARLVINNNAPETPQEVKDLPEIHIRRIDVDQLHFSRNAGQSKLGLDAKNICLYNISSQKQFLHWENIDGTLSNIHFTNPDLSATVHTAYINNQDENIIRDVKIDIAKASGNTHVQVPQLKIAANLSSTDFSSFHIRSLQAESPVVNIQAIAAADKGETASSAGLPQAIIDKLVIHKGSVQHQAIKGADTTTVTARLDIEADNLKTYHTGPQLLSFDHLSINGTPATFTARQTALTLPHIKAILSKGSLLQKEHHFSGAVAVQWSDVQATHHFTDSTFVTIDKLAGSFSNDHFLLQPGTKLTAHDLYSHIAIQQGQVYYKAKDITAQLASLQWKPVQQQLRIGAFSIDPNLDKEAAFRKSGWQTDYITCKGEGLDLDGLTLHQQQNDSSITVRSVTGNRVTLNTYRDKRMPFHHGIEKPMPTQLIQSAKFPFHIDSLWLQQCTVMVHEISLQTGQEGVIPVEQLNGLITNIGNRPQTGDSLSVTATALVLGNRINFFNYAESYRDSLSGFRAWVYSSPMQLPTFSNATTPLAAITVMSGQSDTLFTTWTGNKYAAYGSMDFYYSNLAVKILDPKNMGKKNFILSLENWLANKVVLNKRNSKQSVVFFERDREKFIFNYWVKSTLSGFLTSIGLKRNKKYNKKYREVQDIYSLPSAVD